MLIRAETKYTKKLMRKYELFNYSSSSRRMISLNLLLMFSIRYVFSIYENHLLISTIIFSLPLVIIIFLIAPKLFLKAYKNMIGATITYEFSDNEIVIESTRLKAVGQIKANYDFIEKIYETKKEFYFYVTNQQSYVMNKSDIMEGNALDLRKLLKNKISRSKYVIPWTADRE